METYFTNRTMYSGAAVTVGSSRQTYAFARDGAMPFSKWLTKLTISKVPANAVWFNIAFAAILGIPYLFSEVAYETIVSINTISANISYFIPIWLRITMARKRFRRGPYNMGKYSVPCGFIACIWILFTSVLFVLPTVSYSILRSRQSVLKINLIHLFIK
jgi:amino acid transporter